MTLNRTVWTGALALVAAPLKASGGDLADLTIEELMNEPVTLVAKRETRRFDAPAAIFVITQDDIRRLGIQNIPEALRLVPGMGVGRINSSAYAVSARGFEGLYSDKLLVMVDGRTIYEPTFAGVHWTAQELSLDELDRIEVIRGPGATLWGANAVNGVVNIVTKDASATQGVRASATLGSEPQPELDLRYGSRLGATGHYRAYLKNYHRSGLESPSGDDAHDTARGTRGGFRADWAMDPNWRLMLEGELYHSDVRQSVTAYPRVPPFEVTEVRTNEDSGANLLARWTRQLSPGSELSLQSYVSRSQLGTVGDATRADTFDFELQHSLQAGSRHDVVWGLGYRIIADDRFDEKNVVVTPTKRTMRLYTAFLQDDVTLVPNRVRVSIGSKIEHNYVTGLEVQPDVRLSWTPSADQTVWTSMSRAVRTPDRFEQGGTVAIASFPAQDGLIAQVTGKGQPDLVAETLMAYEMGYRFAPGPAWSADIAAFRNVYHHVIDFVPAQPLVVVDQGGPYLQVPLNVVNATDGTSYGAEVSMQWQAREGWRLAGSYSVLQFKFLEGSSEFDSPQQQLQLRSYLNLSSTLELNTLASYVDRLSNFDIESYTRIDIGVIWHASDAIYLGLWGRNLLAPRHVEFHDINTVYVTAVPRSVVAKVAWTP